MFVAKRSAFGGLLSKCFSNVPLKEVQRMMDEFVQLTLWSQGERTFKI